MKLSDFDFDLPEDLIATRPMTPRSAAKLLFAQGDAFHDKTVGDLLDLFQAGDRLVLNNTRVIPARLNGVRKRLGVQGGSGEAKIEVTLLDPDAEGCWSALIKPLRKVQVGEVITFSDQFHAELCEKRDGQAILRFNLTGEAFDGALEQAGAMPLPPISRPNARQMNRIKRIIKPFLQNIADPWPRQQPRFILMKGCWMR